MNQKLNDYILTKYGEITYSHEFEGEQRFEVKAGKLGWELDIRPYYRMGALVGYEMLDNQGCVSTCWLY